MESQQPNAPLIQLGDLPGVLQTGLVQPAQKIELPTQLHPLELDDPLEEELDEPPEEPPEDVPPDEPPPDDEEVTQIISPEQISPMQQSGEPLIQDGLLPGSEQPGLQPGSHTKVPVALQWHPLELDEPPDDEPPEEAQV